MLVENGHEVTAGELLHDSMLTATKLVQQGVQEGDRVVLVLRPGADFLKIIYANMLIRTVVSIIDPEMGRENYKAKFKQFNPQHAFVDSRLILINEHPIIWFILRKLKPRVPFFPRTKSCRIITIGRRLPILSKHIHLNLTSKEKGTQPKLKEGKDTDDFLVTYTSGTLAEPKGVVHTYQSLTETMVLLGNLLDQNDNERIATHLPHFMMLGVDAGKQVYMWDNEQSAADKLQFIESNRITTLFGPPSDYVPMMQYLKQRNESFPPCVKQFYFGSAPVHAAFLAKIAEVSADIRLTCLYGMTENLMVCVQDGHEKIQYTGQGDLIGKPFPGVQLSIQADGEIGVQSAQQFKRYWHEKTAPAVHGSGDLGELDAEGRLVMIGRKKDMLIRGNFNIYPGLYESTINKIPGIIEAVLIGVYTLALADERVYLIIESEEPLNTERIMKQLKSGPYSIDNEALPDEIIFQQLPRLGRQNKVDRQHLRTQLKKELKA